MITSALVKRCFVPGDSPRFCPINWVKSLLSRLFVPPVSVLMKWPHRTGQVRPLGRTIAYVHAIAAALVVATAFGLCTAAESVISDATQNEALMTRHAASWADAPVVAPLARLLTAIAHPVVLFLASFFVLGVLIVEHPRWESAPKDQTFAWRKFAFYYVRFHACLGVICVAGIVLAMSFCLVFFPGLLGQGTATSLLPWQAWFAIAATGLIIRSLSVTSSRFDEFTDKLTRTLSDAHHPRYQLWVLVAVFVNGLREKLSGGTFEAGFDAVANAYTPGCLAFERRLVQHLASAIEFYRREGLDTLTDPKNPEAAHYTPAQREVFVATFARLKFEHTFATRWLARLTARSLGQVTQPQGVTP